MMSENKNFLIELLIDPLSVIKYRGDGTRFLNKI